MAKLLFAFSVINNRIELTIRRSFELPCFFCHFFGILVCGAHFKGNWPAACNMLGVGVLKSGTRRGQAWVFSWNKKHNSYLCAWNLGSFSF